MYVLIVVAIILCFLFKLLNVNNSPERSLFYAKDASFLDQILKHTPILSAPYTPPRLWGYSGHIQTIIQGAISRLHCPLVNGRRHFMKAPDGATVTYDYYHPIELNSVNNSVILAICPGICNSSESVYIRRVVYHAQLEGFRVAVLNHIGALKTLPITSPRIFSYGNTIDYNMMVEDLLKRFPMNRMICVGFSMGANLVTKFIGEAPRPDRIIAGISICQGYDAKEATKYLLAWEGFRRLYFFVMTENMRAILRRWQKQLFPEDFKQRHDINERAIWSAATLVELDEAYTRKSMGCKDLDEFYRKSSCVHVLDKIKIPMVFVNSTDDPIVPPPLLNIIKRACDKKENFIFIEQKYGGHLGFYEGGFIYPNALSWLDRLVVQLSEALTIRSSDAKSKTNLEDTFPVLRDAPNQENDALFSSDSNAEYDSNDDQFKQEVGILKRRLPIRPVYVCRRKFTMRKKKVSLSAAAL